MADYGGLNNAKMSQKINPMQVLPYHAGWEVLRAEVKFCQARNHRQTFSLPEKGGVKVKRWPRKLKKQIIGLKMGKSSLRQLLKKVKVIPQLHSRESTIEPYAFCPKCGCTAGEFFDHGVEEARFSDIGPTQEGQAQAGFLWFRFKFA